MNKKPIIIQDEEIEIRFRAPSKFELAEFRTRALDGDNEKCDELVIELCEYPSPEEGPKWLIDLGEEDYIKYKYMLNTVHKEIIKRVKSFYDTELAYLRDEVDKRPSVGTSCLKGVADYLRNGVNSPEADAGFEFIWECLAIIKLAHTKGITV